jgi:hypothetical protein
VTEWREARDWSRHLVTCPRCVANWLCHSRQVTSLSGAQLPDLENDRLGQVMAEVDASSSTFYASAR